MKKIVIETTIDQLQTIDRSFWGSETEDTGLVIIDDDGNGNIKVLIRADDTIIDNNIKPFFQWYDTPDYSVGTLNDYVLIDSGVVKHYSDTGGDFTSPSAAYDNLVDDDNTTLITDDLGEQIIA